MYFGLHQAESLHNETHKLQQQFWWELWSVPLISQLCQRLIGQTEELSRPAELSSLLQGGRQRLWEFDLSFLLQTVHLDNKTRHRQTEKDVLECCCERSIQFRVCQSFQEIVILRTQ